MVRRSVSGSVVKLEGSPVIFCSSTQKHVALCVTEAELYAAVSTTQDMLYARNTLLSLGLFVELHMELEVDNMSAVHLANNWSVLGRTRHIDVRQCLLKELRERKKPNSCQMDTRCYKCSRSLYQESVWSSV